MLDPIDGTKGFMTGQGFVIGLALLDAHGDALVGVMGVPAWLKAAPGRRHDPRGRPAPWGRFALAQIRRALGPLHAPQRRASAARASSRRLRDQAP